VIATIAQNPQTSFFEPLIELVDQLVLVAGALGASSDFQQEIIQFLRWS
jgi:hypothetical protein